MATLQPFSNPNFGDEFPKMSQHVTGGSVTPSDIGATSQNEVPGNISGEILHNIYPGRAIIPKISEKSQLGVLSTSSIIISTMIGTGIFNYPSTVFASTRSIVITFVLWLSGALITFCG